ncbi:hypothetical protein CEXT_355691 [Caerostris extrusa]|uniref:Uncharacterized protein n=1 Tax=Caerostris extrusa TaxID=172846 RepID=A0AAV4U7X6_CAEEX|nr:hypothetical protein CEXT_355691 [Caerostris extrusa]
MCCRLLFLRQASSKNRKSISRSVDNFDLAMAMNGNGQENGDSYIDHVNMSLVSNRDSLALKSRTLSTRPVYLPHTLISDDYKTIQCRRSIGRLFQNEFYRPLCRPERHRLMPSS